MGTSCTFCKSLWFPDTGTTVGKPTDFPICRSCVLKTWSWLDKTTRLKMKPTLNSPRVSFYDHAFPPPPAKELRFSFTLLRPVEGRPHTATRVEVEETGVHFDEAAHKLKLRFPTYWVPSEHLRGMWKQLD